jgi:hypothetical protein
MIEPTRVPEVWLPRAQFAHRSHRSLDCLACHENAAASVTNEDILLPSIKICQACHAPAAEHPSGPTGGAGFGCTECHRYHVESAADFDDTDTGSRPRQLLPPGSLKTIRDFLNGTHTSRDHR